MKKYILRDCYKCGVALVVPDYDDTDYAYCQACAFSKIMYDNRTVGSGNDR